MKFYLGVYKDGVDFHLVVSHKKDDAVWDTNVNWLFKAQSEEAIESAYFDYWV
jgi:hypothetical protein